MMSEIKFSDGIEKIKEDYNKIIYPEELLDKKCAGCVRCEKRNSYGRKKYGYHCMMQNYDIDIDPTDKACVHWWNKEEHERIEIHVSKYNGHKSYHCNKCGCSIMG